MVVVNRGLHDSLFDVKGPIAKGFSLRPANPKEQFEARCPTLLQHIQFVVWNFVKGRLPNFAALNQEDDVHRGLWELMQQAELAACIAQASAPTLGGGTLLPPTIPGCVISTPTGIVPTPSGMSTAAIHGLNQRLGQLGQASNNNDAMAVDDEGPPMQTNDDAGDDDVEIDITMDDRQEETAPLPPPTAPRIAANAVDSANTAANIALSSSPPRQADKDPFRDPSHLVSGDENTNTKVGPKFKPPNTKVGPKKSR
jgi:hypothetical protein